MQAFKFGFHLDLIIHHILVNISLRAIVTILNVIIFRPDFISQSPSLLDETEHRDISVFLEIV